MSNRAYKVYKFESTGETVRVPPISTINLQRKINKKSPGPRPPIVENVYGDETRMEENPHDPDYRESLIKHEQLMGLKVMNSALFRVARAQVLTKDQEKDIQDMKAELSEEEDFDENDAVAWFFEIACGNDAEITNLLEVATGMSDPTAEGVNADVKNFRSSL